METEIEIGLETLFEERSEDPCEHSEHGSRKDTHDGAGKWLIRGTHDCGWAEDFVVCDKFFRAAMSGPVSIRCPCGAEGLDPFDVYTVLGRKGVDF